MKLCDHAGQCEYCRVDLKNAEITALRVENARMREALELIAQRSNPSSVLEAEDVLDICKDRAADAITKTTGTDVMEMLREIEASLEEIVRHKGQILLGSCCTNRTCYEYFEDGEKIAYCMHQYGVALGFSECAAEAKPALARLRQFLGEKK